MNNGMKSIWLQSIYFQKYEKLKVLINNTQNICDKTRVDNCI